MARLFSKSPLPFAAATIVTLVCARFLFIHYGPKLVINFTDSVPKGVYLVQPLAQIKREMYVGLLPPPAAIQIAAGRPWFRPHHMFIKQVAGLPGDIVCIENGRLTINGIYRGEVFKTDRQARPLPHPQGCYVMSPAKVFLTGPDSLWTFDSRYFGAVESSAIIGEAQQVVALPF